MTKETVTMEEVGGLKRFLNWLGTYKGLITATIVYEFVIIGFLATLSEPVAKMLGAPLLPVNLEAEHQVARIIMLYHSLAIVFLGAVVFFALLHSSTFAPSMSPLSNGPSYQDSSSHP